MEYMLMPLLRYADFSGRSRRKEYWMFQLFQIIVSFVLGAIGGAIAAIAHLPLISRIVTIAIPFAFLIPNISVAVRRMHDKDRSGWFILIPIVGFVFLFLEGTNGPNRFGEDPKGTEHLKDVFN